jgi:hypothetical protein
MKIYKHNYKNRTVLELEENEITLIAYLIEKSYHNHKDKLKDPLATMLNKKIQTFLKEEI